jgi:hypothetical protein
MENMLLFVIWHLVILTDKHPYELKCLKYNGCLFMGDHSMALAHPERFQQ